MTTLVDTSDRQYPFRKGQHNRSLAENCRIFWLVLKLPLQLTARALGYALIQHGSLARDIDLVAVPWILEACTPRTLAEAIQKKAREVVGLAEETDYIGASNPEYFFNGCPGAKPHGRICWVFHLGAGPYIDLSVFPPIGYVGPFDAVAIRRGSYANPAKPGGFDGGQDQGVLA